MSRNLALNVVLATGSFLMLVASVVVVWRGSPTASLAQGGSARPSAREAKLESELRQRDVEIAALRSEVEHLKMLLDGERKPAEPVAARPAEPDAAANAPPKATSGIAAAVRLLQEAWPDRYGKLTAEEAAALTEVDLRGTKITDDDLALLASLPSLQTLCLQHTSVTDAGLAYVGGLSHLTTLDLRETQITGAGVRQLSALGLTALHLTDTKVTGEELHWLPPMPNLQILKLNRLKFGDDAIADLALFPAVRHLELDGTAITDAGLRHLLAQNSALQRIELRYTSITSKAVEELRSNYPDVELVLDQGLGSVYRTR
jgi:hypothetical protein